MEKRNVYVAVFTKTQKHFEEMRLQPKRLFKRVKSPYDAQGYNFIGAVFQHGWWDDEQVLLGYEELKKRLPELFEE